MKGILITLLFVASTVTANAAWCKAESYYAWGYGTAPTIAQACQIALNYCAVNTPVGYNCYVIDSGF